MSFKLVPMTVLFAIGIMLSSCGGNAPSRPKDGSKSDQPTDIAGGFGLTCDRVDNGNDPDKTDFTCYFANKSGEKFKEQSNIKLSLAVKVGDVPLDVRIQSADSDGTFVFTIPKADLNKLVIDAKFVDPTNENRILADKSATSRDLFAFISIWNTELGSSSTNSGEGGSSAASPQITLPLTSDGTYDFVVDWGDGSSNTIKSASDTAKTHKYSAHGRYTVTIKGTIIGFNFSYGGDRLKLIEISQFGAMRLGNGGQYFMGAENLTITAQDPLDLTGTTYFYAAFRDCKSLTTAPSMKKWDMKNVTQMAGMFADAVKFNEDISGWDVSNSLGLQTMFNNAALFNQDIGKWNIHPNAVLNYIVTGATAFNKSIARWWVDVTTASDDSTPTTCESNPGRCTRKDPKTNLWWSKIQSKQIDNKPTAMDWNSAVSQCANLVYNGKDDWRLPTSGEQASISVATSIYYSDKKESVGNLSETATFFWSNYNDPTLGVVIEPMGILVGPPVRAAATASHYVYCVRP